MKTCITFRRENRYFSSFPKYNECSYSLETWLWYGVYSFNADYVSPLEPNTKNFTNLDNKDKNMWMYLCWFTIDMKRVRFLKRQKVTFSTKQFAARSWRFCFKMGEKLGFKATVWAHTCFCFYVRATSRRLEPIWCTVAWLQNVSHRCDSFSSGWSVTLCGGAVCMAL